MRGVNSRCAVPKSAGPQQLVRREKTLLSSECDSKVLFLLLCLAKSGGDVQPDGGHITGAQPYQGTHGS
jgi:hypothetical protein